MADVDDNIRDARNWMALAGSSCLSALGQIIESQRRVDVGGFSNDAAKQALKDVGDASAHLTRALVHYEMAKEKAGG